MKKLLALALALMLFAVPSLAETYIHPNVGFSLEYPDEWLALDITNIDACIALYENGEAAFTGTDLATLLSLKPQLELQDMVALIDPMGNNMMVTGADLGMEFTLDIFQMVMVPVLQEQLNVQFSELTFTDNGTIVEMNGRQYLTLAATYSVMDVPVVIQQIYYLEGTCMYLFNVTVNALAGQEYLAEYDVLASQVIASFNSNK